MIDYPPEQLDELYENLPRKLREALDSEKAGRVVYDIAAKNDIEGKGPDILKFVGYTLLGLLPPNEFKETLRKELQIEQSLAESVVKEITELVFYPLKENLEVLYKIKIEGLPPRRGPDTYRESVE